MSHEKDSILMPENKEEGMIGGEVCWLFHPERHRYSFHQSSGSSFCTLFVNLENRMKSTFFLIKLNETRTPPISSLSRRAFPKPRLKSK